MSRSFMGLWLIALAFVFAHPAAAERLKLSGSEIRELLAGKTAFGYHGSAPYRIYFAADGTVIDQESNGETRTGTWVATQDQHCLIWQDGTQVCKAVYQDGQQVIWVDPATGAMHLAQLKDGEDLSNGFDLPQ